jgi:hypothetical protein
MKIKFDAQQIKIIGYFAIAIVILNLVLFAFTVIKWPVFLTVLALAYIFVKFGLPKLKK